MDLNTVVQVAVIISALVFVSIGVLLLGIHLGRSQGLPTTRDELVEGVLRHNGQMVEELVRSHRQAMNMAAVLPEQQLDRVNADMIAEAARTGRSPIDERREREQEEDMQIPINPMFDEPDDLTNP